MFQAVASSTDKLVGDVREIATGTRIRAALVSISLLNRPDVSRIAPSVETPRRSARPASRSMVLWRLDYCVIDIGLSGLEIHQKRPEVLCRRTDIMSAR